VEIDKGWFSPDGTSETTSAHFLIIDIRKEQIFNKSQDYYIQITSIGINSVVQSTLYCEQTDRSS
jgi:hypothetical protein